MPPTTSAPVNHVYLRPFLNGAAVAVDCDGQHLVCRGWWASVSSKSGVLRKSWSQKIHLVVSRDVFSEVILKDGGG